jgi:NitT/TauT family transport system substrate-binding protein
MGGGKTLRSCLLALLGLALSACGGTAPARSTASPATIHLSVSYSNVVPDNLPLWIAREAGIFHNHGLDVDLQLIDSSRGIAALLSGQIQFADVGGSETLAAAASGGGLVVLANLTPLAPYVFYAAPGITDAAQLKGKKIGDTNPGASLDIGNHLALKQLGLDPARDVTLVSLGSVTNVTTALLNGAVQASVSHPPESAVLEAKGFHPLADLARQKIPFASVGVVTERSYAAANKSVTQRYVDAIVEAIAREKKDRAFAVSVLKTYFKSSDDALMGAAYDFYAREVVQQPPTCDAAQFTEAQNVLGASAPAIRSYRLSKLYDNSYVTSAAARGLTRT